MSRQLGIRIERMHRRRGAAPPLLISFAKFLARPALHLMCEDSSAASSAGSAPPPTLRKTTIPSPLFLLLIQCQMLSCTRASTSVIAGLTFTYPFRVRPSSSALGASYARRITTSVVTYHQSQLDDLEPSENEPNESRGTQAERVWRGLQGVRQGKGA